MSKHFRRPTLIGIALVVVMLGLFVFVGPLRISITVGNDNGPAAAAPLMGLPTSTPPPPPTNTPVRPTNTAVQPTSTAVPPATNTPAAPTSTSAQPTNTPVSTAPPASPTETDVPVQPTPTEHTRTKTDHDPTPRPTEPPAPTQPQAGDPPQVVIHKDTDQGTVLPGDKFTYTITVANRGGTTAQDVVVTDNVPDVFHIVDLKSEKGAIVVEHQTVTAYIVSLAPGEVVHLRITVEVSGDAQPGPVGNTAVVTTSTSGDDPGDNTSTTTVTITTPNTPRQEPITPKRIPRTADPVTSDTFLAIYGPWMLVFFLLIVIGGALRLGLLRANKLTIAWPSSRGAVLSRQARSAEATRTATIELDRENLYRRWQRGATVQQLAEELATRYSDTDPLVLTMAVQNIIDTKGL